LFAARSAHVVADSGPNRRIDAQREKTTGEDMTTVSWWGLIVLALGIGAALGSALTWHAARSRFDSRLRLTASELKDRHATEADELRAAQTRAQAELVQARVLFKRQLASAAEGPRATALQAEERLRAAYDEMDRLRRESSRAARADPDAPDGFAATRPMPDTYA
jgi:hypothetical protein